ncbi:MAG: hypothetical protein OXU66_05630 [Gammaproteobacteria bacterium]|nr:hypothetical protein [Gammaproteobacteria bacterium]
MKQLMILGRKLQLISVTAILVASSSLHAQIEETNNLSGSAGNYFLDSPDSTKWAVIITGPTVGEVNQAQFRQWSFSLHDILARDYGYTSDTITMLYDRGPPALPGGDRVDGASNREGIEQALAELAQQVETGDQITLYLIGHGSGAEEEAKFNIVGPDITGVEFAAMLDQFNQQDIVIVNTTSASYGFSTSLSSEGRVVISSTRSPSERYDPVFSRFFIEALDNRNGDRDQNTRVSMLEAFEYAKSNVDAWYEEQGRLASEHAGLDDNGDALFALNPTVDATDGRLAEIAYIDTPVDDTANLSPEARELKAQMQDIERSVFILRGSKQDFLEDDYWQQMEGLLVDLARATGRFNEVAGIPDDEDSSDSDTESEQIDDFQALQ